jgi:hypothetical protein
MSAGIHNIIIEQGATFNQTYTWKIDANAVNLAGYTARMQVRGNGSGKTWIQDQVVSLTSATGGGITLGGAAGTIAVAISATTTAALLPGKYFYDLELQSDNGTVTRLLKGTCTVSAEVTR